MSKTTINVYPSYRFINKDPIIDMVRTLVSDTHSSYSTISEDSGVSRSTLNGWFNGGVKRPKFATIAAVVRSMGCDLKIVRSNDLDTSKRVTGEKFLMKRLPTRAQLINDRTMHVNGANGHGG